MRTIALEEHFATPAFLHGPARALEEHMAAKLIDELLDIGDARVAAMDAAGVDVQALSLTSPGVEQLEVEDAKRVARDTNDALAEARGRRLVRRVFAGGQPDDGDRGMGMAHRDGAA